MNSLRTNAAICIQRSGNFHRLGHLPGAISLRRDEFETGYALVKTQLESNRSQREIANKIYADVIADDPTDIQDPPGQGNYVLDTSKDCN